MIRLLFSKKQVLVVLVAVGACALSTSPLLAQGRQGSAGDDANIQRSTQESITTGNDNRTIQQGVQTNDSSRVNSRGNSGNVQDNYQVCDTAGDRNACIQQQMQIRRNQRR